MLPERHFVLIGIVSVLGACAPDASGEGAIGDDDAGGFAGGGDNGGGQAGAGGKISGGRGGNDGVSGGMAGDGAGGDRADGGAGPGGAGGMPDADVGGPGGGAGGSPTEDAKGKFHLYLMIGQSNMEGTGVLEAEDMVAPPRVFKITADKRWVPGNEATSIGRQGRSVGATGVSLGRTFAMTLMASETDPDVTIGLMNLAVSGSPIQSWMDPPPERVSDPSRPYDANYAKMLPYLREALKTGVLKAVLWHQGEANGAGDIFRYLPELIQNLRDEAKNPNLPFVLGEVGLNTLRDAKNIALAKVAEADPYVGLATCENLSLKDNVHYDSASYREYGRRYAAVYKQLVRTQPAP